MSSTTTVSQPSSESSKKELSTSSQMIRFKKFKSSSSSSNKEKQFDEVKSKDDNIINDNKTDEIKSEKLKDKKDINNNLMDSNYNQLVCKTDSKIVLLKDLIGFMGNILSSSYNNLLEIPLKIFDITKYAYEEGSKFKDTIEELSSLVVSRLWNINVRRVSAKNLKSIDMTLYRSGPTRTAFGNQGALSIWNAYGIWTIENFEQRINEFIEDMEEILKVADKPLQTILQNLIDPLKKDMKELSQTVSGDQKQQKIEKIFCTNFFRSISLYKDVCNQINRDGFNHQAFANQFFNDTSLYPQHSANSKIQEWSDSILEFMSTNNQSSLLPTSGDAINKIIPHEYQTMVMSSYAASKLEYMSTPPKILTTVIFQSALSRKLILACLVNRLIESLSNSSNSSIIEIPNELLKDSIKCIVASLFKNIYKENTKINKEFCDAYHAVKSSIESKKNRL